MDTIFANVALDITEDKIYLPSDRIYPTPEGIFLETEPGNFLPLSQLNADSAGCYVLRVKVTKKCPFCDWERISYAFKCRNPNCPSNQPKK